MAKDVIFDTTSFINECKVKAALHDVGLFRHPYYNVSWSVESSKARGENGQKATLIKYSFQYGLTGKVHSYSKKICDQGEPVTVVDCMGAVVAITRLIGEEMKGQNDD